MKILSVIESLGYGGAERLLVTTLEEMVKRGYRCEVAVLWSPLNLKDELEAAGVKVYPLNLHHRWAIPEALWKLGRLIKGNKYNIVHCHLFFAMLYPRFLRMLKIAPPVLSSYHNLGYDEYPPDTLFKKLRKCLDSYTARHFEDGHIAVSRAVAGHFEKHLFLDKIQVVPNTVSISAINATKANMKSIRKDLAIPDNTYLLISVGRFVPTKGHKYIIKAAKIIKEKSDLKFRLILVGRGPFKDQISAMIRDLRLEGYVVLKEPVPHKLLIQWIKSSDLYLQTSIHEAFGITIAEAMALGKPVIASSVDGIKKELIEHDISGILVPPCSPEAIAEAVMILIQDEGKRQSLGENAKKRIANNFNVKFVCDRWEKIYREHAEKR